MTEEEKIMAFKLTSLVINAQEIIDTLDDLKTSKYASIELQMLANMAIEIGEKTLDVMFNNRDKDVIKGFDKMMEQRQIFNQQVLKSIL